VFVRQGAGCTYADKLLLKLIVLLEVSLCLCPLPAQSLRRVHIPDRVASANVFCQSKEPHGIIPHENGLFDGRCSVGIPESDLRFQEASPMPGGLSGLSTRESNRELLQFHMLRIHKKAHDHVGLMMGRDSHTWCHQSSARFGCGCEVPDHEDSFSELHGPNGVAFAVSGQS
jgi:hypothetical protein